MKLTQEAEAGLLQTYQQLWVANLTADMETFASYLVDDFTSFGSANGEIFLTKHEAIEFYAATANQMKDKAQLRNRQISVQALDDTNVVVRETSNLYILIEDVWTFYGFARISCVFRQVSTKWKAVHQHVSFPDHRTEEGQQIAAEKIEAENLQLREAVKRRTIELEHKTKELEVEASVEKVRSRSLAMHKSDELSEVVIILFEKLKELHISFTAASICLYIPGSKDLETYVCGENADGLIISNYRLPSFNNKISNDLYAARSKGVDFISFTYTKKEKNSFYQYLFENSAISQVPDDIKQMIFDSPAYTVSLAPVSRCMIIVNDFEGKMLPETEKDIIKRFANVFDQAYIRFLDLQKAEAQSKEAQIEAALERVRSRSLGMHQTSEIQTVIHTVHEELLKLNLSIFGGSFIVINEDVDDELYAWGSGATTEATTGILIPSFGMPFCTNMVSGIKRGPGFFTEEFSNVEKINYFSELFTHKPWSSIAEKDKKMVLESEGNYTRSVCVSNNTSIFIVNQNGRKFTDEENNILRRFSNVFEQTYTRFLDLKKAEEQAREANIETALERVRSRTMAMQRSDELAEVASLLFHQVKILGITIYSSGFTIWDEEKQQLISWMCNADGSVNPPFEMPLSENEWHVQQYESWKQGQDFIVKNLTGSVLQSYFNYLRSFPLLDDAFKISIAAGHPMPERQVHHAANFSHGNLLFISYEPLPYEHDVFKRFAKVFEQTYTRFLDLQKAEAQVREAKIEAALERVRSRTLAMQKSNEFAETSAILFQQLILLGIEPNRLYITIIKDEQANAEFWITDEDGSKVSAAFETNMHHTPVFKKMLEGWKQKMYSLTINLEGDALQEYFDYLSSINVPFKDGLIQKRRIQYIAFFNKGFIGMASPDEQPHETLQLLERFAAVFNLTFIRFNDLKISEAHAIQAEQDLISIKEAKQKAESTLKELQATQTQLIQAEKMASLGQLTAGIAHEIQNPLNFVNNFSEVSKELLDEMKAALENGNEEEAREIVADIIQNLEKINYHGKRADAIVKGMLQHSRSNSNKKEPTNINALADEYLRLAYHGWRAKDDSFNAVLQTAYDNSIGSVTMVSQDIGRVILNLITNAFYTVAEKKKQMPEGYEPIVAITTKKESIYVEIAVADNGNGIPEKVIDKIFQPFFTTKPTGQGTGLGLSLAYDIIKAHGGELKVNSTEHEGTEFIVQIPIA